MVASFKGSAGPIKTNEKLAEALGLDLALLLRVSERPSSKNYRALHASTKQDGKARQVFSPSSDVRKIQRAIANRILKKPAVITWPDFVFGGIPNKSLKASGDTRDYVACARVHCGARSLLKLDVRNFFDNIHVDLVADIFSGLLRWGKDPAELAAKLCTREGYLPQGGITSSYLALLCLYRDEGKVADLLQKKGLKYTRYVDDITVSSKVAGQEFDYARKIIEKMLLARGLVINEGKIRVQKSGTVPLEVHNLRVGFSSPRLPQSELKRIKHVCKQTELMAREMGRRSYAYRRRFHRAMGLVNKLARVGNNQHSLLVGRL